MLIKALNGTFDRGRRGVLHHEIGFLGVRRNARRAIEMVMPLRCGPSPAGSDRFILSATTAKSTCSMVRVLQPVERDQRNFELA